METEANPNQLFTNDGIPVRTIYVSNLHGTTKIKDLKKFCEERFGPVSSVRIHQLKSQKQNPRHLRSYIPRSYAFVTFTDTGAASKAVLCKHPQLLFNGQQLRVNTADSWHQPNQTDAHVAGPSGSKTTIAEPTAAMPVESQVDCISPLVCINNDCLHDIFKYLNICDIVNVASTCSRLRNFVDENIYKKFVKFELKPDDEDDQKITFGDLQTMLQHFGSIIEEMVLNGTIFSDVAGRRHLQFVLRHCPNLHTLRLCDFIFSRRDYIALSKLKVSSKVKVLELRECDGIYDDWANVLRELSDLQSFIVISNNDISGKIFSKCKNLEVLELIDCRQVMVHQLNTFCKANGSSLRTLKLLNCHKLDDTVYQMITSKLPNVVDLTIGTHHATSPSQLNCLAELKYLKKLFLVCSMYFDNIGMLMRMLGDSGLLEELIIHGGELDAETCGMIGKFKRLQTLRLLQPTFENDHMMDIIGNADLSELREFYSEACNSITNHNLLALVKSKRHLETVNILFSDSVTFVAVRTIIGVLKSDVSDRPLLKLNVDTIEIGDEEKKFLNANRELISVTNDEIQFMQDEYYLNNFDEDEDGDSSDDDDALFHFLLMFL